MSAVPLWKTLSECALQVTEIALGRPGLIPVLGNAEYRDVFSVVEAGGSNVGRNRERPRYQGGHTKAEGHSIREAGSSGAIPLSWPAT